jgi:porin
MSKFKFSLLSACVFFLAATSVCPAMAATADVAPSAAPQATEKSSSDFLSSYDYRPNSPYQLGLTYTGEGWANDTGGLKRGTTYLSNVDASMAIDTDKAFGWTGGKAVVEGFYESYNSPNQSYIGSPTQDPSIIDTQRVEMFRLYQAYYDQDFSNTKTDVKVGIFDPAVDFVTVRPAGLFFNGGEALPSAIQATGGQIASGASNGYPYYPMTSIGGRVRQEINNEWSVSVGAFDGTGDNPNQPATNQVLINKYVGALTIGEVDYTPIARTKIMAGYVYYTGKFDLQNQTNADGSPRQAYGTDGGYFGGNTRLYTQQGKRGLDGFAVVALTDPTVNSISRSYSAGLNYTGLLDARPDDKMGIVANVSSNGDPYMKSQSSAGTPVYRSETNFEATYRAPINGWVSIQPDVQYWIHPAYNPAEKNDLIFGIQLQIGHLFGL